jgi:hypothetical protein
VVRVPYPVVPNAVGVIAVSSTFTVLDGVQPPIMIKTNASRSSYGERQKPYSITDLYIYNKKTLLHTDTTFARSKLVLSIIQYVLDSVIVGIACFYVFFHGLSIVSW